MDIPKKLLSWWSAVEELRAGRNFEIQCDDSGVILTAVPANEHLPLRLNWDRIGSVCAYKRDFVTVDQVRLVLGSEDQQTWIELSEDDVGFSTLVQELPRHLPGCPSVAEWWEKVTFPAFETQWTEVYRRVAPQDRLSTNQA